MEHPARILLVVGEAASRGSVERGIASAGYECVALSLTEALSLVWTSERPCIAIVALVNQTQVEDVAELRELPELRGLPLMLAMEASPQLVFPAAKQLKAEGVCRDLSEDELCARLVHMLRDEQTRNELSRKERDAQLALELTRALASSARLSRHPLHHRAAHRRHGAHRSRLHRDDARRRAGYRLRHRRERRPGRSPICDWS